MYAFQRRPYDFGYDTVPAEPVGMDGLRDVLKAQHGPYPWGFGWTGGRNYAQESSMDGDGDWYFTGSYTWTRYIGWRFELVLRASKKGKHGRSGYHWHMQVRQVGTVGGHDLVERGFARNLDAVLEQAKAASNRADFWVEHMIGEALHPRTAECVYRYEIEQDAWVPFCTHLPRMGRFEGDYFYFGGRKNHAPPGDYVVISPLHSFQRRSMIARPKRVDISGMGSGGGPLRGNDTPDFTWWCYNTNPEVAPVPAGDTRPGRRGYW